MSGRISEPLPREFCILGYHWVPVETFWCAPAHIMFTRLVMEPLAFVSASPAAHTAPLHKLHTLLKYLWQCHHGLRTRYLFLQNVCHHIIFSNTSSLLSVYRALTCFPLLSLRNDFLLELSWTLNSGTGACQKMFLIHSYIPRILLGFRKAPATNIIMYPLLVCT